MELIFAVYVYKYIFLFYFFNQSLSLVHSKITFLFHSYPCPCLFVFPIFESYFSGRGSNHELGGCQDIAKYDLMLGERGVPLSNAKVEGKIC